MEVLLLKSLGPRGRDLLVVSSGTRLSTGHVALDHAAWQLKERGADLLLSDVEMPRKPLGPGGANFNETSQRFIDTVRAMAAVKLVRRWASDRSIPPRYESILELRAAPQVIAIGERAENGVAYLAPNSP